MSIRFWINVFNKDSFANRGFMVEYKCPNFPQSFWSKVKKSKINRQLTGFKLHIYQSNTQEKNLQIFLHIFHDTPKYDDAIRFCGVTQTLLMQTYKVLWLYDTHAKFADCTTYVSSIWPLPSTFGGKVWKRPWQIGLTYKFSI